MAWYMHLYAHFFQRAYKNLFSIALSVYKSDPWGHARLSDLFFLQDFQKAKRNIMIIVIEKILLLREIKVQKFMHHLQEMESSSK